MASFGNAIQPSMGKAKVTSRDDYTKPAVEGLGDGLGAVGSGPAPAIKKSVSPLVSSKLLNQNVPKLSNEASSMSEPYPMDMLLAKLSEQHASLTQQPEACKPRDDEAYSRSFEHASSSNSLPITPATDGFPNTAPTTRPASVNVNDNGAPADEVMRLKLELAQAQNKITRLSEIARVKTEPDGVDFGGLAHQGQMRDASQHPAEDHWAPAEENREGADEAMPVSFNKSRGSIWSTKAPFPPHFPPAPTPAPFEGNQNGWYGNGRSFTTGYMDATGPYAFSDGYRGDRLGPDSDMMMRPGGRRNRYDNRFGNPHPYNGSQYGGFAPGGNFDPMGGQMGPGPMNMAPNAPGGVGMYGGYQHQPVSSALSPHASEFTTHGWKNEGVATEGQTYLPITEPLNYRRLLDRTVNCNWKYIVDKIVCNNDQQASIFLQQKLKVGTPDQKYEIVEAIVARAYPLMVNRFGNFLVQRCFEHGTPEQVIKIANAIRGNTLSLSMDPFGCHVVQKAFDSVPEDYKAVMVHELLRRIPETVIHRYACHVWQKLFELRWQESPPQIMKYVNEALQGMWHEVALGETGSLVVQNIFENCLEEDKRPCIEEVLANIDIVAHGQFGNWCIQHICEHGAPGDRSRAIDHVIRYAAEYSTDQFASKVVEKCLKIGGADFLTRYLNRLTDGFEDRPRIPLIDIASDQYGNYLIQWILTSASPTHRERVVGHIRKHMVSIRGSKFGSRVGALCTNPNAVTRPGPPVGPMGRMNHGARYGSNVFR